MRRFSFYVVCLFTIFSICTMGCKSLPIHAKSEPATIIIRNSSQFYIETVTISGIKKQNQYMRVGAISPLPQGVSQVIGRSTDPPLLPPKIPFCWVIETDNKICKQMDLRPVLNKSNAEGKALVFEILTRSEAMVYLED